MDEFIGIAVKCIGIVLVALCTYVIVPAIKDWRNTKLTSSQQEQLTFWVETGVLWAKQVMQTATGEAKKEEVMNFVMAKIKALNLPYTREDVDKAIEAVYNSVKDMTDVATGKDPAIDAAAE